MLLALPLDQAAQRIPATPTKLVEAYDGMLVHMRVDSLDWTAGVLAGLGRPSAIRRPDTPHESTWRLESGVRPQ